MPVCLTCPELQLPFHRRAALKRGLPARKPSWHILGWIAHEEVLCQAKDPAGWGGVKCLG